MELVTMGNMNTPMEEIKVTSDLKKPNGCQNVIVKQDSVRRNMQM